MSKGKLFVVGIIQLLGGFFLAASCLFVSAGTMDYSKGWAFLAMAFGLSLVAGILLLMFYPHCIEKRLFGEEKDPSQRMVVRLSGLLGIACLVGAGISRRYTVLLLPDWCSWAGGGLFVVSLLFYICVMIQNSYLSRQITVEKNQIVVDTGPYSVIRHPLYLSLIMLGVSSALLLGGGVGCIPILVLPFVLAQRIKMEELFLRENLFGYSEYMKKVKYRLIPFLW